MTNEDAHVPGSSASRPGDERSRAVHLLNQAHQAVRSRLDAALAPLKITAIQHAVLDAMSGDIAFSSAELARRFFVTPQTMNELITGLQRRGLVSRRQDAVNRRILRMSLTEEGRRVAEAGNAAAYGVERSLLDCLGQDQQAEFRDCCRRIASGLREPPPKPQAA